MKKDKVEGYAMADSSYPFRTALGGFHKGDVTGYIEKTVSQHRSELLQREQMIQTLQEENRSLQQQLNLLMMTMPVSTPALEPQPEVPAVPTTAELEALELQAYRRAEAVERNANARVQKLYQQMEGVYEEALGGFQLTDSAVKEAIEVMLAQTSAIEQVYKTLSGALNASREKLGSMTGLLGCAEDD